MKRIWKFLRNTLWIAVIAALVAGLVVGGLRAYNPMMDKYRALESRYSQPFGTSAPVNQYVEQRQPQPQQGHGKLIMAQPAKGGHAVVHYFGRHDKHHFGFGPLAVSLLLLLAGWVLRKKGGRKGRFIGTALIIIALLHLLFMSLVVIIPAVVIYLIWRAIRRRSEQQWETETLASVLTETKYTVNKVDALDEWEAKTRRELNNAELNNKEEN